MTGDSEPTGIEDELHKEYYTLSRNARMLAASQGHYGLHLRIIADTHSTHHIRMTYNTSNQKKKRKNHAYRMRRRQGSLILEALNDLLQE